MSWLMNALSRWLLVCCRGTTQFSCLGLFWITLLSRGVAYLINERRRPRSCQRELTISDWSVALKEGNAYVAAIASRATAIDVMIRARFMVAPS